MLRAVSLVLLLAAHSIYADTIGGKVVKVTDGDTINILDARNAH